MNKYLIKNNVINKKTPSIKRHTAFIKTQEINQISITTNNKAMLNAILARIEAFNGEDISMTYVDPTIGATKPELQPRSVTSEVRISFRLPARFTSPLMDTGKVLNNYINSDFPTTFVGLEQNTLNYLNTIGKVIAKLNSDFSIKPSKYHSSMEKFLHMMDRISATLTVKRGSELESLSAISRNYATEIINLDLKQATMREELVGSKSFSMIDAPPMLTMIMRVRAAMTRGLEQATISGYEYHDTAFGTSLKMDKSGWTIITKGDSNCDWLIMIADRWCATYSRNSNIYAIVPMTYMDYYYTKVEILYNMKIVAMTPDYEDIRLLVDLLEELSKIGDKHDLIVDFMKSFEGLVNMTADFKADPRCSVGSILDVYNSMSITDEKITGTTISIMDYFKIVIPSLDFPISALCRQSKYSILYRLANSLKDLNPTRLLEVSSLHKFCFYSVIDEELGIKKLAKRTHTPRDIDYTAIRTMHCYFNREYTIEFTRRHKRLPQVLSDESLLIESDIVKELGASSVAVISDKFRALVIEFKKYSKLSRDTYPLDWWFDLRPYDCEEDLTVGTPIEHAKDKRSAKQTGSYTAYDTEKELERIIRSETINFRPLTKIIKDAVVPQSISYIQQGKATYNDELTTILKEKEREQKKEGRLFGMLTTEGKQSLSKMMTKAEHVLSYFKGNLMTPSDSERKKTLHWMAQSLLDDDKYAIMADIEGHNQSMQFGNTADLLESIGLIYGEQKWSKLSRIFSNLNLFYAYAFEDYTFLSKGQLGGIEGWMNPVWTLHTVIVTSLLPELTGIDIRSKAVYSDDIAVVISLPELTEQTLNATLKVTQDHFYRYGMILKALQTVVSKFRITMLRQHYICGVRSDSSLKRMISASTMGNQFFHCDEIESAGLISAVSSSLELSNSVYPQLVLKWLRLSQLLIRPFLSSIMTEISSEIMNENYFNSGTVAIYRSLFPYERSDDQSWIFIRLKEELRSLNPEAAVNWLKKQKEALSIKSLSDSQRESAKYQLIRLMREDKSFITLFLLRCLLPVDMGGVNAMVLEQMVLTGFRDSLSRNLSIIKNLYKPDTKESSIINICLTNVMGGNGKYTDQSISVDGDDEYIKTKISDNSKDVFTVMYDESSLVTQEWPTSLRQITPEALIKGKLLALFKKICVNKELKDLLMFDDYRQEFKTKIVDELRGNFYGKIARFYIDTSGFMIVDKILSKVENTSSLIRRVNKFPKLCKSLAECSVKGPRKWLLKPIYNYGRINETTNIQEYLFFRRSYMFPRVSFVPCIEPEANSVIMPAIFDNKGTMLTPWSMQCTSTSGMSTVDGKQRFLPPLYGNEALYKGSLKDENEMFVTLKEALVVKCVSVTKWIIYRSDETKYFTNVVNSNNITNCADLSLSTLGYGRFRTYQASVPLLTRSEIAHRIPVLDQKPKAVLRCLPSQTTKYKVTFNQSWVYAHNLSDSDIHFDYFKMRLICAEAISMSLHEPMNWSKHYYVKLNPLIRDVQFNYLVIKPEVKLINTKTITKVIREPVSIAKINWLATALPSIIDGQHVTSMPKIDISETNVLSENNLSKQLIIEYYKSLKSQNLWDYNPLWSDSAWSPFIKKYKSILNSEVDLTPETIKNIIHEHTLQTVQRLRSDMAPSNANQINKAVINRISYELLSDDEELIDTCDQIIELMTNVSRLTKDKRSMLLDAQEILNLYSNQHNKLLKEMFFRIVIENCLVVTVAHGQIQVDVYSSEAICEEMLQDLIQFIGPTSNKSILAMLITKNLTKEELRRACISIIEHASEIVNSHDLELDIHEESIVKIKYEQDEVIDPRFVNEPSRTTCRFYSIVPEKLTNIRNLANMIEYRSKYVQSRGDPSVYDSPLCSDVYMTAYNLLFSMRDVGLINHDSVILDLTAGRGEFNIALMKLGINAISLNRRDQYCAMKSSKNVKYLDDYDWASDQAPDEYYSELSLLTNKRVCAIFDISHLGDRSSIFTDRILDTLAHHETTVIRFKPILNYLDRILKFTTENSYRVYLSMIGDNARLSPYSYIIITKVNITETKLSDSDESLKLAKQVVKDIRSVFQYSSSKPIYKNLSSCSIYEDFDLINITDMRIKEIISVAVNRGDSKVKHEILANMYSVTHYYIPDLLMPYMSDEMQERIADITLARIGELDNLKDYGYKQYHMAQKTWSKVAARCFGRVLPAYKLTCDDLNWLRNKHPVQALRKTAHLLFRSDLCELRINNDEFVEHLQRDVDSDVIKLAHWGPRSRNFYDAVLLIVGNSMHNDPSMHHDILKINYQLNLITRRNYFELLRYTNMMTPIQDKFDNFLSDWVNESEMGKYAMEEFYDRYIRKLNYYNDYKLSLVSKTEEQITDPRATNHKDSELAKLFLESMDKVMDIDIIGKGIITDSSLHFYESDDIINTDQVNNIINAGITGIMGDVMSEIRINEEVIREDEDRLDQMRKNTFRSENESEDQYESRLKMMSLIASMNDTADDAYDEYEEDL